MKGYCWGISSVALVTLAQLLMKWGMMYLPQILLGDIWLFITTHIQPLLAVCSGLVGYVLSMLCWFFALRYLPLNQVYPLLSISYVLVYLLAVLLPWFNETATLVKTLGTVLILSGVWLICSKARTSPALKR